MLVNIQQPLIREDGTVLLATDCKVTSRSRPSCPLFARARFPDASTLWHVEGVPSPPLCLWDSRVVTGQLAGRGCSRAQHVRS